MVPIGVIVIIVNQYEIDFFIFFIPIMVNQKGFKVVVFSVVGIWLCCYGRETRYEMAWCDYCSYCDCGVVFMGGYDL